MKILRSIILFIQHLTESNFVFSLKFSADTTLIGQNIIAELLQLSCLYNKRFLRFLWGWSKEPALKAHFAEVLEQEIKPGKISAVNPALRPPRPLLKGKSEEETVLADFYVENCANSFDCVTLQIIRAAKFWTYCNLYEHYRLRWMTVLTNSILDFSPG